MMLRLIAASIVTLLVLPSAVAAECPVADDLKDGIVLERFKETFIAGYQRVGPRAIDEYRLDTKYAKMRDIHHRYVDGLVSIMRLEDGKSITIFVEEMPETVVPRGLGDEISIVGSFQMNGSNSGLPIYITTQNMGSEPVQIGECIYQTAVIDEVTRIPDWDISGVFRHFYSADLGISLKSQRLDGLDTRKPVTEVRFDRISKRVIGDPI